MSLKSKFIVFLLIVAAIVSNVFVIRYFMTREVVKVSNKDNKISIVCKRGSYDASGECYINAKEGQKLVVESKMKSGKIRLVISNDAGNSGIIDVFSESGRFEYDVLEGDYEGSFRVIADGTTGKLTITAE